MEVAKLFSRSLKGMEKLMRERAKIALQDDAKRDITGEACLSAQKARARIIFKERAVFCGLIEAREIFKGLKVKELKKEGEWAGKDESVLEISGEIKEISRRIRTALNYISFLSGIATASKRIAEKHGSRFAGLRKTHPCLTASVKRALKVGGALTHRYNLEDGYMLKREHIGSISKELKVSRERAIEEGVMRAILHRKKNKLKCFIEVEAMNLNEAKAAAKTDAEAILLDNMKPAYLKNAVKEIRKINKKILLEASGGIDERNVESYLKCGEDFASMSALTMGAKPVDVSMRIMH